MAKMRDVGGTEGRKLGRWRPRGRRQGLVFRFSSNMCLMGDSYGNEDPFTMGAWTMAGDRVTLCHGLAFSSSLIFLF